MAGIVFLKSVDFTATLDFYTSVMDMSVWLEQPDITILRHENMLVGFQNLGESHETPDAEPARRTDRRQAHEEVDVSRALLTFFYPSRDETDAMYRRLSRHSLSEPQENIRYRIYNFYARDPEGRLIECQTFLHALPTW